MINLLKITFLSHSSLVPYPMINMSLSRENDILAGSSLAITCDIDINDQVDTSVLVNIEWTMFGIPLTSNDRITVGGVNETGFNQYRSQVSFSTLSSTHDSGIYNCTFNITSGEDYIYVADAGTSIDVFITLNVTSKLISNRYSCTY